MSKYQDEERSSRQQWLKDAHEKRQVAESIREVIPSEWIRTPPIDVPQHVEFYNRALQQYAAKIRPKRDQVGEKWNRVLAQVEVPPQGVRIDAGLADAAGEFGDGLIYDAEWVPRDVSLSNLRTQWSANARVDYTIHGVDRWQGEREEERTKELHIPVWAADMVYDQLNDCLNDLQWLPTTDEPLASDEPPDVPDHIREQLGIEDGDVSAGVSD